MEYDMVFQKEICNFAATLILTMQSLKPNFLYS